MVEALDRWISSPDANTALLAEHARADDHRRLGAILSKIASDDQVLSLRERFGRWAGRLMRIDLDEVGATVTLDKDLMVPDGDGLPLAETVTIRTSITIGPRGQGLRLILGDMVNNAQASSAICDLLARAVYWKERWFESPESTLAQVADDSGRPSAEIGRELQLAFLAPEIIDALVNAKTSVTAKDLRRLRDLPPSWAEQRSLLGVVSKPE